MKATPRTVLLLLASLVCLALSLYLEGWPRRIAAGAWCFLVLRAFTQPAAKHPYSLRERLRYCWRLLTRRGWLFYCQDGPDYFRVGYAGLTTTDARNVCKYLDEQVADTEAGQQLLDTLHNLNPGIAPAADK